MAITVSPLDGTAFGAAVEGVAPLDLNAAEKKRIHDAYLAAKGLLTFPFDRMLNADELHALTAVFGANEFAPGQINGVGKKAKPGDEALSVKAQVAAIRARGDDPFMAYIGNVEPRTGAVRTNVNQKFFGEWEWHTDMSYIPVPPTFSLLHARIVPDSGGDTGFCNQVMAASSLPEALRERILPLRLKHDSTYGSSGMIRPGMTEPASPVEAEGHAHPILREIPGTGKQALFLGRRTNAYIMGLPLNESEALVNELWAHATQPAFCYQHRWTEGEVVVWDNRMLLHMRTPMAPEKTRFMWRTQTRGESVVPVTA